MADNFTFIDRTAETDQLRLVKSVALLDAADDTYFLARIPQFAFVSNIVVQLISPYGTTSTMTVGFSGNKETADPDAFLLNVNIDPDGSILTRSMLVNGTGVNSGGKWFDQASGAITLTLAKGNAAATASSRLFVEYKMIFG
jgi:hypothetical protein